VGRFGFAVIYTVQLPVTGVGALIVLFSAICVKACLKKEDPVTDVTGSVCCGFAILR
jgi:hypothetical protein